MTVLFIVIPIALLLAGAAVGGFVWMARTGQMDDLETPPMRMLFDDEAGSSPETPASTTNTD